MLRSIPLSLKTGIWDNAGFGRSYTISPDATTVVALIDMASQTGVLQTSMACMARS